MPNRRYSAHQRCREARTLQFGQNTNIPPARTADVQCLANRRRVFRTFPLETTLVETRGPVSLIFPPIGAISRLSASASARQAPPIKLLSAGPTDFCNVNPPSEHEPPKTRCSRVLQLRKWSPALPPVLTRCADPLVTCQLGPEGPIRLDLGTGPKLPFS